MAAVLEGGQRRHTGGIQPATEMDANRMDRAQAVTDSLRVDVQSRFGVVGIGGKTNISCAGWEPVAFQSFDLGPAGQAIAGGSLQTAVKYVRSFEQKNLSSNVAAT